MQRATALNTFTLQRVTLNAYAFSVSVKEFRRLARKQTKRRKQTLREARRSEFSSIFLGSSPAIRKRDGHFAGRRGERLLSVAVRVENSTRRMGNARERNVPRICNHGGRGEPTENLFFLCRRGAGRGRWERGITLLRLVSSNSHRSSACQSSLF